MKCHFFPKREGVLMIFSRFSGLDYLGQILAKWAALKTVGTRRPTSTTPTPKSKTHELETI